MKTSLKLFKSPFIFFFLFPFFITSMDQPYPQLQLQCKQPEKIYSGTLQIASLPFYCSNVIHQEPESEMYKFNLTENNPMVFCILMPRDTSEYETIKLTIPTQQLFNCNDGSSLQLSFPIVEDNQKKLVHFNAQCKKSEEEQFGSDFVTQFTNFMRCFYQMGAGTTNMFFPHITQSLIRNEILKKEDHSQNMELVLTNDDGTTERIIAPLHKLVHGPKGCSSEDNFKYIMMANKIKHYSSKNILNHIINREIGR